VQLGIDMDFGQYDFFLEYFTARLHVLITAGELRVVYLQKGLSEIELASCCDHFLGF